MQEKKISFWLFLLILYPLLFSCAARGELKVFLREGVDPKYITKVAVLKFENHTNDPKIGERMRDLVIMEILALGLFDVVDKTVVEEVLLEEGLEETGGLNKDVIRRLGKRLDVQALMVGSVITYENERIGNYAYPIVALSLRLLDVSSGAIIWEASGTETAYTIWGRLFGWKPKNATEASFNLVERLLKTLKL